MADIVSIIPPNPNATPELLEHTEILFYDTVRSASTRLLALEIELSFDDERVFNKEDPDILEALEVGFTVTDPNGQHAEFMYVDKHGTYRDIYMNGKHSERFLTLAQTIDLRKALSITSQTADLDPYQALFHWSAADEIIHLSALRSSIFGDDSPRVFWPTLRGQWTR